MGQLFVRICIPANALPVNKKHSLTQLSYSSFLLPEFKMQEANQLTINVISFNKASSITKDINTTLIPIKNCIAPKKGKQPHYGIIVTRCTTLDLPLCVQLCTMLRFKTENLGPYQYILPSTYANQKSSSPKHRQQLHL